MLTPSSDEDSGFLSPVPIPKMLLPSQQQFLVVDSNSESSASVRVKKSKKLPTLEELTNSLRRQNPEKYNTTLPSLTTPSQSVVLQEPTSTPTKTESDSVSTRRRASISLANALVRRQSSDNSASSNLPVAVSLSRRGSGVPTLASLGERLLDKRALDKKLGEEVERDAAKENEDAKEQEGSAVEEKVQNPTLIPSDAFPLVPTSDKSSIIRSPNTVGEEQSTIKSTSSDPSNAIVSSTTASHPLQHSWTFYFQQNSTTSRNSHILPSQASSSELRTISTVSTLQNFGPLFNHLKRPSQLATNASIFLFKDGIKPEVDNEENKKGGKFVLRIKGDPDGILIDRCWTWLVLGLVGDSIEDDNELIMGAVISIRPTFSNPRSPVLSLWLKESSIENVTSINSIGTKVLKLLELNDPKMEEQIQFDFIPHFTSNTTTTTSNTTTTTSTTSEIKKPTSPFMSINTFKKLSSSTSSSPWKLDRVNSTGNKSGIVGGVLGNVMAAKNLSISEKVGGWRDRDTIGEEKKV